MIEIKQLSKFYRTAQGTMPALDDINIHIKAGEIYGVIGKSGAGKSTLIRCVNGLEQASSGQVIVAGDDITQLSGGDLRAARRQMSMIFQHFNLLAQQTVYDNIAFPLKLAGMSKQAIDDKVQPLLQLTELVERRDHYPAQLSGGQKQRVAIARALASDPKVLLCDEATSALDPETTHAILNLLKRINKEMGLTIMLITHEMEVIKQLCHRVALIESGRIVHESSVMDFFTDPKLHQEIDYLKVYLRHELPPVIQEKLLTTQRPGSNPLVRIYFKGKSAAEPILAHMFQALDIELNIIQANMEYLQQALVGTMLVEVLNGELALARGLDYLANQQLTAELIGYIEGE